MKGNRHIQCPMPFIDKMNNYFLKHYMGKFYKYSNYKSQEVVKFLEKDENTPKVFKNDNFLFIEKISVKYDHSSEPEIGSISINRSMVSRAAFELTLKIRKAVEIDEAQYQAFKDIAENELNAIKALYQNINED